MASIQYSNSAIGNFTYGWDANHNKTSESISGVMSGYGFTASYDYEDRLTGWTRSDAALTQSWNLSAVGNWDSFTQNASTQTRTHSPANELLTAAGQSAQMDAKGNTTLLPANLSGLGTSLGLKWDSNNKLRAADTNNDGTDDVLYLWDALGRRVGRTASGIATVYFQNGAQTLADYTLGALPSSPTCTYLWGGYIDELVMRTSTGGNHYFHRNQQYSITAVTTSTGVVAERYTYSPYGELTILNASATPIASSAISNRYMYTGREWDATLGLYHFRARWMSGLAGRFMQRDPIGFKGSKWNLYTFLGSNSLTRLDPSGLVAIKCQCRENTPYFGGPGRPRDTKYTVTTDCTGLGGDCCREFCRPNGFTGRWEVGDAESDRSAEEEYEAAIVEIQLCCMPTGGAAAGYLACVKGTARILRTKLGHFILEYTVDGITRYAHMPGWNWIGDEVSCKGVAGHIDEGVNRSPPFPIRHPDKIPGTKCVKNCFWTVVRCAVRAL